MEEGTPTSGSSETEILRAPVPMPPGIGAEELPGSLRLVRSWFSRRNFFLAIFCLLWDGFLVYWYPMIFLSPDAPWFVKAFPLMHVALGVGLTYAMLAGFFNKTVIDVGQGMLHVRHGPFPWPGNRNLSAADVTQLYCEEKTSRGENSFTKYWLNALLRDGKKLSLLAGLEDKDKALYLEQRIESRLGIADRRVGGELPRG